MPEQIPDADLNRFLQEVVNLRDPRLTIYRNQVRYLREQLTRHLNAHPDFRLRKLLGSGSLAKHTSISVLNDIDVAAHLSPEGELDVQHLDTTALLYELRGLLMAIYGRTKSPEDFEVSSSCVRIHYHGTGLDVEIVPVLQDLDSKHDEGWVVRGPGELLRTCIPRHKAFIKARAQAWPRYRELVRLTKWWKTQHDVPIKSFLIELLWAHLVDLGAAPKGTQDALELFFDYLLDTEMAETIAFSDYFPGLSYPSGGVRVYDPVNPDNNVAEGLTDIDPKLGCSKLEQLLKAADVASALVSEARAARTRTRAIDCWAELLGPRFKGSIP